MTETTTAYGKAAADHARLTAELAAEKARFASEVARLTAALRDAERILTMAEQFGADVAESYVTARDLLDVKWAKTRTSGLGDLSRQSTPEVAWCFNDAITDLRTGTARLFAGYFGVKSYDRWSSQREDHAYNFGPKHGHVWFRIGLTPDTRARIATGTPLTEEERLTCIRYLRAVQDNPDGMLG